MTPSLMGTRVRDEVRLRLRFPFAHPNPAARAAQHLAAAHHVFADAISNFIEIANARFELEIEGNLVVLIEDGRCLELRVWGTDLRQVSSHGRSFV